jgi:hypothetical protein
LFVWKNNGVFIKELEPTKFIIDGFLNECSTTKNNIETKQSYKYFKKIYQNKNGDETDSKLIPILKNNIITTKK